MGVMSCYRKGCDNIMCDTYIQYVGYICYECQEEFKKYAEIKNKSIKTHHQIITELKIFMDLEKSDKYGSDDEIDINDFFNENTK